MASIVKFVPWSPENFSDFDPSNIRKNEGRGERKYAMELMLRKHPGARQNTPGENPDVVGEGIGREVKEMDGYKFRVSGAIPVMLSLSKNVVRRIEPMARLLLTQEENDMLSIGCIKATSLRIINDTCPGIHEQFFRDLYEHSKIDRFVFCTDKGYSEVSLEEFCDCFEIYSIDKFIAKIRLKPECRDVKKRENSVL